MGFDSPRGATTNHQFQETEMTDGNDFVYNMDGLTKRELFAAMAMQGMLAMMASKEISVALNQESKSRGLTAEQYIAGNAARQADALIAELNKETTT